MAEEYARRITKEWEDSVDYHTRSRLGEWYVSLRSSVYEIAKNAYNQGVINQKIENEIILVDVADKQRELEQKYEEEKIKAMSLEGKVQSLEAEIKKMRCQKSMLRVLLEYKSNFHRAPTGLEFLDYYNIQMDKIDRSLMLDYDSFYKTLDILGQEGLMVLTRGKMGIESIDFTRKY